MIAECVTSLQLSWIYGTRCSVEVCQSTLLFLCDPLGNAAVRPPPPGPIHITHSFEDGYQSQVFDSSTAHGPLQIWHVRFGSCNLSSNFWAVFFPLELSFLHRFWYFRKIFPFSEFSMIWILLLRISPDGIGLHARQFHYHFSDDLILIFFCDAELFPFTPPFLFVVSSEVDFSRAGPRWVFELPVLRKVTEWYGFLSSFCAGLMIV